jgi:hypothetical protein
MSINSTPGKGVAFGTFRTVPNTRQPCSANFSAAARPMPDDTPVTTTTVDFDMVIPFPGGLDCARERHPVLA